MDLNAGAEGRTRHSEVNEQTAIGEICEACNSERDALTDELDKSTYQSNNPIVRRTFIQAHLSRLDFEDPESAATAIHEYETHRQSSAPSFDVTSLPLKRLIRIVDRHSVGADQNAHTLKLEETRTQYHERVSALKSAGKTNVELVAALVNDPTTPKPEREKLQAFQSILSVAQLVPADAQIIATRMNTMDFSKGVPNPQEFVTWAVFDNPNLSSGISEATQTTIATKLGITRHKYAVKTGGDVKEVFEKGIGVETYLDEHGVTKTRTVPLAPGQDVKIRDNQYLSVDNAGNKHLKITTAVGDYQISLPDNPTNEDMTQIVASTQMIAAFHDLNLAEVFYNRPLTERGGGEMDLRFPGDFNRTKQLCQILFGGLAGFDGEILEQSDIDKIPSLMQLHSSKGDAIRGDVAPEMMQKELETQGVINNGSVNWLRFEELIELNRAHVSISSKSAQQ